MNSLPMPSKIICVGRNYVKHIEELNNERPEQPLLFLKPPSAIIATGGKIVLPEQSNDVHFEVEVAVIIGKQGKNINEADALDHVQGYGLCIDITARDLQDQAKKKGYPWSVAKGFDTFFPLSAMVNKDTLPPSNALQFSLTINETLRQQGNTSHMIFPIPYLLSYISSIFTLEPGDIIATGTPEGVGKLNSGDRLVARLEDNVVLDVSVA